MEWLRFVQELEPGPRAFAPLCLAEGLVLCVGSACRSNQTTPLCIVTVLIMIIIQVNVYSGPFLLETPTRNVPRPAYFETVDIIIVD